MVAIFPSVFDKENQFSHKIPEYLKTIPEIQHLRVIKNAFLPLIKFEYKNINFDLLMVGIGEKDSPELNNKYYLDNEIRSIIIEQGIEKKNELTKNQQY